MEPSPDPNDLRAAGGVVWRPDPRSPRSQPLIALVHRPRYNDWSLPKGKLKRQEHPLVGAVREVREETSIVAVPQAELPSTRYRVTPNSAQPVTTHKTVRYWSMRALSWNTHVADHEVDGVLWVPAREASDLLTYPHDRLIVDVFLTQLTITAVVVFTRDAPSTPRAHRLAVTLAALRPTRIVSASPARCQATCSALATLIDVPVEINDRFDDLATAPTPLMESEIHSLASTSASTVICAPSVPRGSGWLLALAGTAVVAASSLDGLPPPHPLP